jgi:citrate lyase subunit beta/citryl-CoA lyase
MRRLRPARFCRSWLFLEGANEVVLSAAPESGADVLIQELEDFTPPELRSAARALAPDLYAAWRAAGRMVAVRINPLDLDGMDDLVAVMRGAPDIVALPKVADPFHVTQLDEAVTRFEREYGIPERSTALLPNIEFARGLIQTVAIARASRRTAACLMASEDMAADLGAERGQDGLELAYCRQRFLVECVAADVVAVDCPYTFSDADGVTQETRWARRMGYVAKSLVDPTHAPMINGILSPSADELARARRLVAAFDTARAAGQGRVELDGALVEMPAYQTAKRLLARHEAMLAFERGDSA